jgi:hypothetical protein
VEAVVVAAGAVGVVAAEAAEAEEVVADAEAPVGSGFDDPRASIDNTLSLSVGGRLSHFCAKWRQLPLSTFVWDVVSEGHCIPFRGDPPASCGVRETSGDAARLRILQEEVAGLLDKGAVERVPFQEVGEGWYSTYFLVPKKTGDWRPILNLKPLNKRLVIETFKMETLKNVILACSPGEWLASLDLKDAYFHVPVHPAHRRFLRFCLRGVHYQYRVLPFGLSTSPRVFTKVLAPVIESLRVQGVHIHPYLDDLLLRARSREQLLADVRRAIDALQSVGFLINFTKSEVEPALDLTFIGGRLRTDVGRVFLPQDRMEALIRLAQSFRVGELKSAKTWLALLGIMAAAIQVVPYARMRMRPLQLYLLSRWNAIHHLLTDLVVVPFVLSDHIAWWTIPENLACGMPLSLRPHDHVVTTDASGLGWGGLLDDTSSTVKGVWDAGCRDWHINRLELRAVQLTLVHFQERLRGSSVLIRADNTTTCAYINRQGGTRSPDLCVQAWHLFTWAIRFQVELRATYLPGLRNVHADSLSRVGCLQQHRREEEVDQREWSLRREVAQAVFIRLDEPQIDLFATFQNKQCPVFCALEQGHGVLCTDGLTLAWGGVYGYAFPPIALIPRVLAKMLREEAMILLIAPRWPGRPWYTTILHHLIAPPLALPDRPDLLWQLSQQCLNPSFFKLTAWKLSGRPSDSEEFRRTLWNSQSQGGPQARPPATKVAGECFVSGAKHRVTIPLLSL